MKLSLIVGQGKLQGKEVPITLSPFLIGRDPHCHLRPASPLVSKRHCALILREGKAYLKDFDSTNGTHINDKPVKGEVELHDGDELKVGPVEFKVKLEATIVAEARAQQPQLAAVGAGAKATQAAGKASGGGRVDEDAVADMLLSFGDEAAGNRATGDSAISIPAGSTVMDVVPVSGDSDPGKEKTEEGKKGNKQVFDAASTSNAAKAILEKYMRRPRT